MTNGSPGVLVDQGALTDALQAAGAQPENVTEWWLRTRGHVALAGLPPGTSTAIRAQAASHACSPTRCRSPRSRRCSRWRSRRCCSPSSACWSASRPRPSESRDVALLDALGMPPRQVARLLGLEQGLTAVAPERDRPALRRGAERTDHPGGDAHAAARPGRSRRSRCRCRGCSRRDRAGDGRAADARDHARLPRRQAAPPGSGWRKTHERAG